MAPLAGGAVRSVVKLYAISVPRSGLAPNSKPLISAIRIFKQRGPSLARSPEGRSPTIATAFQLVRKAPGWDAEVEAGTPESLIWDALVLVCWRRHFFTVSGGKGEARDFDWLWATVLGCYRPGGGL